MALTAATPPRTGETQGKTAQDENFPVGSRLIPARLRPSVAAYYHFARLADDIADAPDLSPEVKLARLDALDAALLGANEDEETAKALRHVLSNAGVDIRHARELLIAFRRDAANQGCADWAELLDYCRYSAAPVGRFLLDLHGEDRASLSSGDALCAAHQILNHIQDCRADARELGRIYLPADWLAEEGVTRADIEANTSTPALRRVLNRMLDGCAVLLDQARPLSGLIAARGLRLEVCIIHALAQRLLDKLRTRDPLAEKIKLDRLDWLAAGAQGLLGGITR